jgi:hypothetical protein
MKEPGTEMGMNSSARVTNGMGQTVSFLKHAVEALCQAVILVGLACLITLIVAGTFGILHKGDDFAPNFPDGRGGGGGDAIILTRVLS